MLFMNKGLNILLGLIICLFVCVPVSFAFSQKKIGVTAFQNNASNYRLSELVTNAFCAELSKDKEIKVIERIQLNSVVKEQAFGKSGLVSPQTAASMGNISGLSYIVIGSVDAAKTSDKNNILFNESKAEVTISVRVIDAVTGTVVAASSTTGEVSSSYMADSRTGRALIGNKTDSESYGEAAARAAAQAAEAIKNLIHSRSLSGYVVEIHNPVVYIDLGSDKGVSMGHRFTIVREGTAIRHLVTGELLGKAKEEVGVLEIGHVDNKMASGILLSGHYSDIQIGDRAYSQ